MRSYLDTFDFSDLTRNGVERVGEFNPYITLACDLRCRYCYMFDFLAKARDTSELMPTAFLLGMTAHLCDAGGGLDRMTLLGGEPTLHPDITDICNSVADMDIRELRMTTNGVGLHHLQLDKIKPSTFDHVSISVDGIDSETNDATRGKGTFARIIDTIGHYRQADIRLSINYTVTRHNIDGLSEVIPFFRSLGVSIINFHRASLDGNAYRYQDILVDAREWVSGRDKLLHYIYSTGSQFPDLTIRIPYIFLSLEEMRRLNYVPIQQRNYHSPQGGHRLIVFPATPKGRGLCYMSSDLIGQPNAELGAISPIGLFTWNDHPVNELVAFRRSQSPNVSTDIKGQNEGVDSNGLIRVSHSFKAVINTSKLR